MSFVRKLGAIGRTYSWLAELVAIVAFSAFLFSAISPADDDIQPEFLTQHQRVRCRESCKVIIAWPDSAVGTSAGRAFSMTREGHWQVERDIKVATSAGCSIRPAPDRSPPRFSLSVL